jgi:hypothetical protein
VILVWVFILIGASMIGGLSSGGSSVKSTIQREKLDTGNVYINDCIIDELGWFEQKSSTSRQLKKFWDKTGVQPYIILKAYDATLTTDEQKEQWAKDYYDSQFDTENIFLYVYFAEQDTENDVGYMAYANGYQTSSVMDSEAVEIFWNYIDKYWYSDASTDEVFINAFTDTANTIMKGSSNGTGILKWLRRLLLLLVIVAVAAFVIIRKRNKDKERRVREQAEEKRRILNTPNDDAAQGSVDQNDFSSE